MIRPAHATLLLLALTATLPAAARADSIADEADFRFHHAAKLYREGKVEEALGEFLASNRLVRNRNVIFNIARSFEQLQRYNEAYRFYTELLQEQGGLPAADRTDLDAALARLRPRLALLRVESDPPGATVFVDRRDLGARGQTPLVLALPAGAAMAVLEREGFRPAQAAVQLNVGKTVVVRLALERIYGTLVAEGEPAEFELRLDSADAVVLSRNGRAQVLPGRRVLHLSAPGFTPQQLVLDVPEERAATARFTLAPLPPPSGALVVRANLDGALVRIDGKEVGFTPGVIDAVPVGVHTVEVLADGREPDVRRVPIKQNESSFIEVKLRYLEARVVAAERQLTRAHDAPASITVLSADEIRGFGWVTLAEALRSVRGLYVSSDRDYDSIGVRGFSTPGTYNNRVLVLSDGHVTNELSLGQGYVGRDFDAALTDVERIEIVRGPGSVLYGSAAFFAVVNVVHRTPAAGASASARSWIGSLGENTGAISLASAGEAWSVLARASGSNVDGDPVYVQPGAPQTFANNLDGEKAGHADLRAHFGGFALAASYNDRRKTLPTAPFETVFGTDSHTRDQRGFVEAAFSHAFESGFAVDARGSWDGQRYAGSWNYRDVGPGSDGSEQAWVTGELRFQLPAFFGNRVFLGGEAQDRYSVKLTNYTPGTASFNDTFSERIASFYAGDDLKLGAHAQLDAAVRIDDYLDGFGQSSSGAAQSSAVANPRLALILEPYEGATSKLLFGTAFRAPGFYERYYSDGLTQIAAVDLQPERVQTGELEHTHPLTDEITLLGAGYVSRIENLISLQTVRDAGGDKVQYRNGAGLVHSAGLEAEVRWQPAPGALLSLWYAYARARDGTGNKLPNSPEHSGALRLLYPVVAQVLSVSTEIVYGSRRQTVADAGVPAQPQLVGESLLWNVGITGEYARWKVRYGLFGQNLLDQRVLLPGGAELPTPGHAVPQLGRTLRLQLGFTL